MERMLTIGMAIMGTVVVTAVIIMALVAVDNVGPICLLLDTYSS